jgi:hypothetical protein
VCRLEVVQEVAHVSCLVTSLVGLKQRQGAAVVAALRGGISQGQRVMISHYLPFLIEDQDFRLPGEPSRGAPSASRYACGISAGDA